MGLKKFNVEKELRKLSFRRNKNKYLKYRLIVISLVVVTVVGIYFSKSKYANNGIMIPVSTKVAPFVARDYIIAAYIDGEESVNFPSKSDGYVFDHVACDDENVVATWDSNAWGITTSNISKRTKCTVYFITKTTFNLKEEILAVAGGTSAIEAKGTPDFSTVATTDEGMYMAEDDYGKSYYYRGAVTNNNVLFANFCWKIIRVNGNGSIRMIYNGTPTNNQCTTQTGKGTQIGTSAYIVSYSDSQVDNAYVGYMFGGSSISSINRIEWVQKLLPSFLAPSGSSGKGWSTSYAEAHSNINSSIIKQTIDRWYENNLTSYASYLSDTLFCNDRSVASSSYIWNSWDSALSYGSNITFYGSYNREKNSKIATLKCPNKNDRFTVSDTTTGNGALTYPIALITADEIHMAGGFNGALFSSYTSNYLYTNQTYTSMSPGMFQSEMTGWPPLQINVAHVFYNNSSGNLTINEDNSVGEIGVRPVINLKADIESTDGNGISTTPYVVVTE